MDRFNLERKLTESWKRQFYYPSKGSYEKKVRHYFQRIRNVKSASAQALISKLKKSNIVIWGVDRLVTEDENLVQKILPSIRPDQILKFPNKKRILAMRPKKKRIWMMVGALHLPHLKQKWRMDKTLWVHLEPYEVRWRTRRSTGWVSKGNEFFYVGRSPLTHLFAYRHYYEKGKYRVLEGEEKEFFTKCIRELTKKGRFPKKRMPRLFSLFDPKDIQKMLKTFSNQRVRRFLISHILKGESITFPNEEAVVLSTLSRGEIAEEAVHSLRLVKGKKYNPVEMRLEEAIAFHESLKFDPSRRVAKAKPKNEWERLHLEGYRLGQKWFRAHGAGSS